MYSSQDNVEAYLDRELTEHEVILIDDLIVSISQFINAYCNREWLPLDDDSDEEVEATVRYYNGTGAKELFIDDFIGLEEVKIVTVLGETVIAFSQANDWLLFPANKNPKQSIRLRRYHFPVGNSNVEVTAIWGAGSPPAGVVQVCTALVGNYISNLGGPKYKKESIEGYSYELSDVGIEDEELKKTLDIYKKFSL